VRRFDSSRGHSRPAGIRLACQQNDEAPRGNAEGDGNERNRHLFAIAAHLEGHDASWQPEARSRPAAERSERERQSASAGLGKPSRQDGQRRNDVHRVRGLPRPGADRLAASAVGAPRRQVCPRQARGQGSTEVAHESTLRRHRAEEANEEREGGQEESRSGAQRRARWPCRGLVEMKARVAAALREARGRGTQPTLVTRHRRVRHAHGLPNAQAVSCEGECTEQQPDDYAADEKES